tara:strand:- start:794 stop:1309 length:516 start_codon:yes stop_codon:yes gene_type:complete
MITTTIATSIQSGNYKHMRHNVDRWTRCIERNWALICKAIGISEHEGIIINWRPIRGSVKGTYSSVNKVINMDSRKFDNTHDMMDTLGHELTHYKQYNDGVLDQEWSDKTKKWLCVWNGKRYKQASTYNSYFNRPWEIDARKGGSMVLAAYSQKIRTLREKRKTPLFSQKA